MRPRRADLAIDRFLPIGHLADFLDLDDEVVRPGPIGMAAGAALIDAFRQLPHAGDTFVDLLPQKHAATARLSALADNDFDAVGAPEIIRVHTIARRQHLINQGLGGFALFRRHAAIARSGAGARRRRAQTEGLLGMGAERAEAHAGDGDRDFQFDRLLGVARPQRDAGFAALAVAFQWVARCRGTEEQQIIQRGKLALGAKATDGINAFIGHALNLGNNRAREGVRFFEPARIDAIGPCDGINNFRHCRHLNYRVCGPSQSGGRRPGRRSFRLCRAGG